MSDDDIGRAIENHIKKIAKLLPDTFESEDLLEDLRSHIYEAYNNKVHRDPSSDKLVIILEVLEVLGTPEEIAAQYVKEQSEEEKKETADRWIYYTMRLMVAVLVVVLSSWVVSIITEGAVDFMLAVVVLLAFAFLESIIRAQQTKDA